MRSGPLISSLFTVFDLQLGITPQALIDAAEALNHSQAILASFKAGGKGKHLPPVAK